MSRRLLFREDNVSPHGMPLVQDENYDLEAWVDEGTDHGVVIVRMDLQFKFFGRADLPWHRYVGNPGPDADPEFVIMHRLAGGIRNRRAAQARVGDWTDDEKEEFMATYKSLVQSGWSWKVPLRTDYRRAQYREFQVEIRLEVDEGANWADTYEVNVVKITSGQMTSAVARRIDHAWLDSNDLAPRTATGGQQIACIHEFGHMLGLPDEYAARLTHWAWDTGSIMNVRSGTHVRPRHLTPIADWLSRNYRESLGTVDAFPDLDELEFYAVGTPDDHAGGRWTIANSGFHPD